MTAGIRRDAERWLRTLKDGGPRSRPRRIATVHSHLGKALPALLDWSARYHHLREVTRDDIQDHVRGLHGSQRHNTLVALRSLFGFCLSAGVTFRNPARGIKVGRRPSVTVLQPLGQEDIDDAVAAAATPAARLIVALAGVHAARSSTICAMLLSDADPGSGRLLLGGQPRPLDDLTARLLRAWLEARRARWPGTANPHLLINAQTALGTGPASRTWASSALRGHAATIEALRVDRQLEEALATGADPLHLAATFGLDPGTAVRYASSARQLLQTAAEQQDPAQSPRTQGPDPLKKTEDPSVPAGNPSVRLNSGERGAPGTACGCRVHAVSRSPVLSYLPDVVDASRIAVFPLAGTPAGTLVVRAADLRFCWRWDGHGGRSAAGGRADGVLPPGGDRSGRRPQGWQRACGWVAAGFRAAG